MQRDSQTEDSSALSNRLQSTTPMTLFVDNARFWSMFSIVALHCIQSASTDTSISASYCVDLIQNIFKFGTIVFFLISGFLLGEKFETGSRSLILRRRLSKILLPWSFWYLLSVAMTLSVMIVKHQLKFRLDYAHALSVWFIVTATLTHSIYWFVPNLFLSTCILLALRKHLRSYLLGGLLSAIAAFYAANIYYSWIPTSHTTAIGGYVVFLWLGHLGARHYDWLARALQNISIWRLSVVVMFCLSLSFAESIVIRKVASADPDNTLRLSNQLYSLAVALLLLKLKSRTWPKVIEVRKDLFGVYLVHIFILTLSVVLLHRCHLVSKAPGLIESLALGAILTLFVFASSVFCTHLLKKHRMSAWTVGGLSRAEGLTQRPALSGRIGVNDEPAAITS